MAGTLLESSGEGGGKASVITAIGPTAQAKHLPWLTHQERALPDVAIDGRIAALSRGVRSTRV